MGYIDRIPVDTATLAALEQKAHEHGTTLEEEAGELIRQGVRRRSKAEILARLDAIAAMTPKDVKQTDSAILLREDRNR